ncbi:MULTISPECIES: PepSY-like domain-containing protein [unclassified Campylobacter]|uniref:PepSY-like domain-containing protein n=1 Tax=unclassified Campylobacter TaxID=2593542 RepID=UPI001237AD74|nr:MULTISPECIES: PepSY-like domain-containing protein [unclassified Campylobacter]KAA6225034.1 hypothetical protein FMM54_06730 [Campylobacter sp. LR185c]KAA6225993.1 hypothetical protein FMM55_05575 [Campylobacter sp. LR196d]KAA6226062.1 hypothetical protein FMM57_06615 [Campylobacter sp. LR286c]KAA6230363.1 hypothetical protein FMM56_06310 [Campylobacter sp. LR264d]KAA6230988.1 hypothetical protein FMM58_03970 [Campylobacter sp. LR291e]
MKVKHLVLVSSLVFCAYANPVEVTQSQDLANPVQVTPQAPATQAYPQNPVYPQYPQQNYTGFLPQKAMNYIQRNYPNTFIKDIDFEGYGWEVELSNNLDVYFDRNGNFLGAKWD